MFCAGAAAQERAIGYVKTAQGDAFVQRGAQQIAAEPGMPVMRGDRLLTEAGATLGVTLRDNTVLSIGPRSAISLSKFEFEPAENRYGFVVDIARGTLHYISGLIAKLSAESVSVNTPVASVAVRGTRFLVRVDE